MFETHIPLKRAQKMSAWRKISLGSWRPTGDSSIYTMLELDARPMLEYLENKKEKENIKANETHFAGLVMAKTIAKFPHINKLVRFGRIYERENVDIFFHMALDKENGEDLTGFVVRQADKKTFNDLTVDFKKQMKQIIDTNDKDFKQIKSLFRFLPGFLSRPLLDLTALLFYNLNIWSPLFGAPKDPFGSIQISSIGSIGGDNAFVPIAPYTRIPMVLALGTIKKRPFVINDTVEAIPTIKLCFTFDHRIMDGFHFIQMQEVIKDLYENPYKLDKES